MGIFSRLRHSQAPAPLPDMGTVIPSPWSDGSVLESVSVAAAIPHGVSTRHAAMQLSVVARARNLIAPTIARLPMVALGTDRSPVPSQPGWLAQPEAGRPGFITWTWVVDSLIFYPWAWLEITDRDSEGRPRYFRWVPEFEAQYTESGRLTGAFGRPVGSEDWIRIDGPHEGILCDAKMDLNAAQEVYASSRRAGDNPVPSIDLHQESGDPLTSEEIDELLARWRMARRRKGGGVSFTNKGITANTLSESPEQLMIAGLNKADMDLARHLNIAAWAADIPVSGTSLQYSNVQMRYRELLDLTLAPYMAAITGRLGMNDLTPRGQTIRYLTDGFTAADFSTRMAADATAISSGMYTPEELRQLEVGLAQEGI